MSGPDLVERLLKRGDPSNAYAAPVDADRRLLREAANEISALKSRIEIRAMTENQLPAPVAAAEMEAQIRRVVDDAMNSAIPEPWEVSAHAAKRIMALIALSHPAALSGGDSEPAAPHRTAGETIGGGVTLKKLPVEFRVLAHGQWLHFEDEQMAQESADMHGVDYQGLYARDGAALAPPPVEPVLGVTEAMVEAAKQAVWNTETPFFMRDYLMYDQIMRAALTAALATAPEGSEKQP